MNVSFPAFSHDRFLNFKLLSLFKKAISVESFKRADLSFFIFRRLLIFFGKWNSHDLNKYWKKLCFGSEVTPSAHKSDAWCYKDFHFSLLLDLEKWKLTKSIVVCKGEWEKEVNEKLFPYIKYYSLFTFKHWTEYTYYWYQDIISYCKIIINYIQISLLIL